MPDVTTQFDLLLPSAPENVARIESLVEQVKVSVGFTEESFGNILVALTEAVNNAIIHGNKCDPSKNVEVNVTRSNHTLSFTVKDQGVGYDYRNLPDPTAPENLEKLTGRGVFLMNQLSDMVIFSDNGSRVELQFKI